jgi:Flp pilus assembly protein TadG
MLRKVRNRKNDKGQSMVEFALALPIVLLIVFGIIEFGYMLFVFSSVNTASRNAARYGIAVGEVTGGELRYYDCDGIIEAGLNPGRFAGIVSTDFSISYDSGPSSTTPMYTDCPSLAAKGGVDDGIGFGDRIIVTVNHQYQPLVTFMGLDVGSFTMTSTSSRTIVKGATILVDP